MKRFLRQKKLLNYLEVYYQLYPQEVKTITDTLSQDLPLNIKKAVEIIGISTVIDEVGLSTVIDEVGLSTVIDEVGVDTILNEIGREKIEKWLIREKKKNGN